MILFVNMSLTRCSAVVSFASSTNWMSEILVANNVDLHCVSFYLTKCFSHLFKRFTTKTHNKDAKICKHFTESWIIFYITFPNEISSARGRESNVNNLFLLNCSKTCCDLTCSEVGIEEHAPNDRNYQKTVLPNVIKYFSLKSEGFAA